MGRSMNRIFKVIWSKTKHCFVVVSELAKNQRKCHSVNVKRKSALAAAVLLALTSFCLPGMPSVAQAADGTESMKNNDYVGANGYYWYFDEEKNQWREYPYKISSINNNRSWRELPNYEGGGAKEPGAVTAGLYAQAGEQTVTIGNRNAGQSKGSVFIGELNGYNDGRKNDPVGMKNNYVTAVGFQSNATGWGSIAIGSNAVAENTNEISQVVKHEGSAGTSGTVQDDNYGIELNPKINWSSVALGYSAKAKDGNIAIGAYSDATDTSSAKPYVSVGSSTLQRRITNVADGTGDTDVATVGQMNKAIASVGAASGWTLTTNGSSDSATAIKAGTTVDFSEKAVNGNTGNLVISQDGSNVAIGLNKDLKGITSITSQTETAATGGKIELGANGTTISGGNVNVSNNKVTGLAEGNVNDTSTDAITGKQLNRVQTTLNDKNHNIKYYSVNSMNAPTFGLNAYTNEKNDGASGRASLAAGFITHADGLASTVAGSYSGIYNKGTVSGTDFRGAAALSLGTVNINRNMDTTKPYSGVANSLIGQANVTTDSNAAIILGAGNTVKDSYRTISNLNLSGDMTAALKEAVPGSGGQVMVMGGGNSVENAYMTQVTGVGNTVTGSGEKYDKDSSTQLNYVDGFYTTLENGKNDYIIGSHNTVTGTSTDNNKSNIVFGDNHTLTNTKNNVILGSLDAVDETTVSDVVSIGHNAKVTKEGGVAIGSGSEATTAAGVAGYDPTGATADTTAAWTSKKAAVSVGTADETREITGVAAGKEETDAVNVAQLKKLEGMKANVDASNIGANLKGSDGKTAASASDITANEDAWGTAIGTGTIASTSGQLVTGKTVYGEVRPTADGTYIKTANTTAANLTALDTQVGRNTTNISNLQNGEGFTDKGNTYIKNLAKGSIGMENGSHTTVSHWDANGVETYKVDVNVDGKVESGNKGIVDGGAVYSAIQDVKNQTSADLANKANVDASNLTPNNVTKWQEKLGNGKVESGNTGLVTGDTVFKAVDTKANRDGSNLTDKEADSFSEKIARGEVKDGENRAVSGDAVSQAISKVTGDMNTQLDGKANTSLDNITEDGQNVIRDLAKGSVKVIEGTNTTVTAVDGEGETPTTYAVNVEGKGTVTSGNTGLISGGTAYTELRPADGTYVKRSSTTAANLSALDTGLKNTSSLIHTNTSGDTIHIGETSKATKVDVSSTDANGNKNGRVVTGVVTDAKDANSAANVGYVNGVTSATTQQLYRDMDSAYSRLDNNINRAAAGANALAALHPLDYDPDDKLNFAAGFGHYHNANAAAVGAFYYPNERTMINVGFTMGNGDPGVNAGVSFRLGKGSIYNGVSKAAMAQTIHDQSVEIDNLKKENQEMKQQIQEILKKLNG